LNGRREEKNFLGGPRKKVRVRDGKLCTVLKGGRLKDFSSWGTPKGVR